MGAVSETASLSFFKAVEQDMYIKMYKQRELFYSSRASRVITAVFFFVRCIVSATFVRGHLSHQFDYLCLRIKDSSSLFMLQNIFKTVENQYLLAIFL